MSIDKSKLKQSMEGSTASMDAKGSKDSADVAEENALKYSRERAEIEGIRQKNRNTKLNRKLRSQYANKVFCYLVCYSIFVGLILIFHGYSICGFTLPDNVLSFLVGSTAAAAIGLVYSVSSGLFTNLNQ